VVCGCVVETLGGGGVGGPGFGDSMVGGVQVLRTLHTMRFVFEVLTSKTHFHTLDADAAAVVDACLRVRG
jgi:hypothetical protein